MSANVDGPDCAFVKFLDEADEWIRFDLTEDQLFSVQLPTVQEVHCLEFLPVERFLDHLHVVFVDGIVVIQPACDQKSAVIVDMVEDRGFELLWEMKTEKNFNTREYRNEFFPAGILFDPVPENPRGIRIEKNEPPEIIVRLCVQRGITKPFE
jgi:hypothetical protein